MAKSLYVCYFGFNEPLVQTQVIPYLRELGKGGHELTLLTFEPGDVDENAVRETLATEGVHWHWLRYHKRFSVLATAWDILCGTLFVRRFISRNRPDILHGRVHVPTLMGALARKLSRQNPKLLFDIRGFFPEEYTDAGVWPENGVLYRSAKRVERWLLKESDGFVVLTEKARAILFPESETTGSDELGHPVEVIPCCVDLRRFESANSVSRDETRRKLGIDDRRVIAYVGAFGGWYLTKETADFFSSARETDANTFAMILTQSPREMIEPLLRERGFTERDFFIGKVPSSDVPRYLSGADLAVSFIKPCYSKQASSPTKNAEFLACGLPIIANAGVGDVDSLITIYNVGSLLSEFSASSYIASLNEAAQLNGVAQVCRETAAAEFDLESVAGVRYRRVYSNLLAGSDE